MRGGKKPRTAEDGELRATMIPLRVSPSELLRIERAANGRPLATWVRGVVLAAAPSVTDDT